MYILHFCTYTSSSAYHNHTFPQSIFSSSPPVVIVSRDVIMTMMMLLISEVQEDLSSNTAVYLMLCLQNNIII